MIYAKPMGNVKSRPELLCKACAAAETHCSVLQRARCRGLHSQTIWITTVHPRCSESMDNWSEFIIDKGVMQPLSHLKPMGSVIHWCYFVQAGIQVHPWTTGRSDPCPTCPFIQLNLRQGYKMHSLCSPIRLPCSNSPSTTWSSLAAEPFQDIRLQGWQQMQLARMSIPCC